MGIDSTREPPSSGVLNDVKNIERRRDQLAHVRQTVKAVQQSNTAVSLEPLRYRIEMYRRQDLAETAREAGLAAGHFDVVNYYPSSELLFATVRDTQNGSEITFKGDRNGVKLERSSR